MEHIAIVLGIAASAYVIILIIDEMS